MIISAASAIKKINLILPLLILLPVISGCFFGETKTEEHQRGRLKYVETLKYGLVGTHGSKGWYVDDRALFVGGKSFSPEGMNFNDAIASCEASPNEAVEALKCHSFEHSKETAYVLRMKDDNPVWETAFEDEYIKGNGNNLGEWTGDGKWLVFKDLIYNVQTGEKREVKGAPDYPYNHFRAVSPDLQTIVYQGSCFFSQSDFTDEVKKSRDQVCAGDDRLRQNNLEVLWLIEAATGKTKFLELSRDKYDWLVWNQDKTGTRQGWLIFYQKQLVWEKDKDGKFQLVFPK